MKKQRVRLVLSAEGTTRGAVAVRARYEVASQARAGLWPGRDSLSADAALNPGVRRTIRERCRTQVENDPIAEGMIDTLANDTVGCGPRLQMMLEDEAANRQIEQAYHAWAAAASLGEKLRLMRRSRAIDGESFAMKVTNPRLASPVKLDVKVIETDQVTNPAAIPAPTMIDGIELDEIGEPIAYTVLRYHPGDSRGMQPLAWDRIEARNIIHYFKRKRAGQHRGVSDIAPALIRFAYLHRFTLATLLAAEHAADHAGVIKTDAAPDGAADLAPMDEIEIDKGTFTTMPAGWSLEQLKAEHPATTFEMFRREIIGDIARCIHMPVNVATLNSSGFNFSSGKLDHLVYHKSLGIERDHMRDHVVEPLFAAWLEEAQLVEGLLPPIARTRDALARLARQWMWQGAEAIDPLTEAKAESEKLRNGTGSLARAFARMGMDWRDELDQRVSEVAERVRLMKKYRVTQQDMAEAACETQVTLSLQEPAATGAAA